MNKLLIVDLYGDGDSLRIVEDTPKNRKLIEEFQVQDAAFAQSTGASDYEGFTDFMESRGAEFFCAKTIKL